jgi:hypothetical protein
VVITDLPKLSGFAVSKIEYRQPDYLFLQLMGLEPGVELVENATRLLVVSIYLLEPRVYEFNIQGDPHLPPVSDVIWKDETRLLSILLGAGQLSLHCDDMFCATKFVSLDHIGQNNG